MSINNYSIKSMNILISQAILIALPVDVTSGLWQQIGQWVDVEGTA